MRIERIEGNEERKILTAMIVDSISLGRIASKWEAKGSSAMFRSRWADIVGTWCVKFHEQFGKAPRANVQGLFESWAKEAKDKDTVALVEKFLVSLNDEYKALAKEINSAYIIDLAAKHFTAVKIKRTIEIAQGSLDDGKLDKAVEQMTNFSRVEMGAGASVDILNDQEAIRGAFEEEAEDLIQYPGALGYFFKGQLTRDSFVSFIAPEKRGKTYWLIDAGWRAMLQRRRVAWFACGDMSERQMLRRLAARAAQRPVRAKEWPCEIPYPMKMRRVDGVIQVKHEMRCFEEPLGWRTAWKAFQEVAQYRVKGTGCYFRLVSHPNSTLSVRGIDAQLKIWEKEGWVPDVVITDYADILDEDSAMPGASAPRDKINASWKQQRALSQKWHLLYLTATQADAEGGLIDTLGRGNFSEDKRKLAHVTGMVGINQTAVEKKLGVYRLNWIVLREGEFSEGQTVCTSACLALGNPAVRSCW